MADEARKDDGKWERWFDRFLCLLAAAVVGAHFVWPDLIVLELAAIACVIVVGGVLISLGSQLISGARTIILDLGAPMALAVLGTMFAFFFSWTAAFAVLGAYAVWTGVGGLRERASASG